MHVLPSKSLNMRLKTLLKTPLFWLITLWGNACIFGGALFFYSLEYTQNPALHSILDSLGWAVGIVTTVGGSEIHPVTDAGKILAIFMMMGGALFLWSYMALFIGILVEPELGVIQREVSEIQNDLRGEDLALRRLEAIAEKLETATKTGSV